VEFWHGKCPVTRLQGLVTARFPDVSISGFHRASRVKISQMLDEGFWAEIKVGGEHLRLFSECKALGIQASVYNVNTKSWIAPSEPVDDIEQGKEKAAAYAETYLKRSANLELPHWSGRGPVPCSPRRHTCQLSDYLEVEAKLRPSSPAS
jgi:hypothetical protein